MSLVPPSVSAWDQVRRHNIAVKHLASGQVGKAAKGHMFTKSPPNRRTRLDFHATPVGR